jgi:hypothetical protein
LVKETVRIYSKFDWPPSIWRKIPPPGPFFLSIVKMGRRARINEDAHRIRHEQERLRKQRKREQLRLAQHTNPSAQLANVITQQKYLGQQNEVNVQAVVNESWTKEGE